MARRGRRELADVGGEAARPDYGANLGRDALQMVYAKDVVDAREDALLGLHHSEALVRAYAEAGGADACRRVIREMRRSGAQPGVECYSLVVAALSAACTTICLLATFQPY